MEEAEVEKAANQQKLKLPVKTAKACKKSKKKRKPQHSFEPSSINECNNVPAGKPSYASFVPGSAPSKRNIIAGCKLENLHGL